MEVQPAGDRPVGEPAAEVPVLSIAGRMAAPGGGATGLTHDGRDLWVSTNLGSIFRVSLGGDLEEFSSPEPTPEGLTSDGETLWVFTTSFSEIIRFVAGDGTEPVQRIDLASSIGAEEVVIGGFGTHDLSWDDGTLWAANSSTAWHLDTAGNVLDSVTRGAEVTGLEWDGERLWVASMDATDPFACVKVETLNRSGQMMGTYQAPLAQLTALAWIDDALWALGSEELDATPEIFQLNVSPATGG